MKILLVSTNRERSPYPVAPLGAMTAAAAARRAGHQVDLLDLMFSRSFKRKLKTSLQSRDYQLVAFSIRNLDNCLYCCPKTYTEPVRQMSRVVRSVTDVPLVVGGSGFSLAPNRWLQFLDASFGIVGEAETSFPALLERISAGRSVQDIPGVICRAETGDPPRSAQVNELLCPAHDLCNYTPYISSGGYVSVQTKRGCPYNCTYCTYPKLEGAQYRLRDPASVVDELQSVSRSGKSCPVYFADSVFNTPREHALAICRLMTCRNLKIPWLTYCNPLQFDLDLAGAMVEAGCVGVEFGIDTACEKMLSALRKPFGLSDIRNALLAAAKANLPFAVHLLFGGPGETPSDVIETQKFLDSCSKPNAVFATLGIRIYTGTVIEQIARRDGLLSSDGDLFEPVYYLSPAFSNNPAKMLDGIARMRAEWSTPTDWNSLKMRILQKIMNLSGVRPQWLNAANYGKYIRR